MNTYRYGCKPEKTKKPILQSNCLIPEYLGTVVHNTGTFEPQTIIVCDKGIYISYADTADLNAYVEHYSLAGEFISGAAVPQGGHSTIGYDKDNNILLLSPRKLESDWSPKKVLILHADTLAVLNTIDTSYNVVKFTTYDGRVYGICDFEQQKPIKLYTFTFATGMLYRTDTSLTVTDFTADMSAVELGHEQGIAYDGQSVYLSRSLPNTLKVSALGSERQYVVKNPQGRKLGELEGLCYYKDSLYFLGHLQGKGYRLTSIYKIGISGNYDNVETATDNYSYNFNTLYVDNDNAGFYADGTLDKPFRTIQEAVNYLSLMQGYKGGYINVKSTYKDNSGKNPLTLNHLAGYTIDITGEDVGQLDISAHDSIGSIIVKDASQLTGSVTRSTMYFSCNTAAVNSTLEITSGTCVTHNITFSDIDRVLYEEV